MTSQRFSPETFQFFVELEAHNNREWFQENKARYERVALEPALAFISEFGPELRKISKNFNAIPKKVGGSLFRIYRDVRFSKDKRPYKTHLAMRFTHRLGKDVHAPGYYVHLEPGSVFVGLGIWRPDRDALGAIRKAIVDRPKAWREAIGESDFTKAFERDDESLKRAPKGFDPEHELIVDLRRKNHVGFAQLTEEQALEPNFSSRLAELLGRGTTYMRFLCKALDVPF